MMKLCTMASMFVTADPERHNYLEAVRRLHAAGFRYVDPNFHCVSKGWSEMSTERWRGEAERVRDEAEKLGVVFPQMHLPYPKMAFHRKRNDEPGCEYDPQFLAVMSRAVEFAAILGVKWCVAHPLFTIDPIEFDREENLRVNLEYYGPLLEKLKKHGIGLAVENLVDQPLGRRFGASHDELIALVQAFNDPLSGICWDFGHGNRMYLNQVPAIKKVAPYLRATHVDDNYGSDDLHMPPFQGKIEWAPIMRTLREIGYDGAFTMETRFTQVMPESVKDLSCRLVFEIGEELLRMAQN